VSDSQALAPRIVNRKRYGYNARTPTMQSTYALALRLSGITRLQAGLLNADTSVQRANLRTDQRLGRDAGHVRHPIAARGPRCFGPADVPARRRGPVLSKAAGSRCSRLMDRFESRAHLDWGRAQSRVQNLQRVTKIEAVHSS